MGKILFVGVDVDDTAFHGAAFDRLSGEYHEFKCKPTFGALKTKLEGFAGKGYELRVCYEATYLGFPLCRELRKAGILCDVIAPSLIPETSGRRVKTDRLDSIKLARLYSLGELTAVTIPDERNQQVRDYIRIRETFVDRRSRNRKELLSLCASYDLRYKQSSFADEHKEQLMSKRSSSGKMKLAKEYEVEYWTGMHFDWLNTAILSVEPTIRAGFEALLEMESTLSKTLERFESRLAEIAEEDRYRDEVLALCSLKGVQTLTALTVITEIGDIRRFPHPQKLTSYIGMDIIEYSSGGKEKKFGITKMGNRRVRTCMVESSQSIGVGSVTSRYLQRRRAKVVKEISDIAVRGQERLRSRSMHLTMKGKHTNKVKMACARELANFVWEIMTKVADMKSKKLKIAA